MPRPRSCLLALAAGLVLAWAPAARADFNIHHFWGNPSEQSGGRGGEFAAPIFNQTRNTPNGVAVNDTTGDVYVADSLNNRIQQFSEDGDFIRAWGADVGPAVGNEVQVISRIPGPATDITLTFQGQTTEPFSGEASAATVQAALETLPAIGAGSVAVSGSGTSEFPWVIAFQGALGAADQPPLIVKAAVDGVRFPVGTRVDGFAGSNPYNGVERQAVMVNATAGDFRLGFGAGGAGVGETGDLPATATAAAVESALNSLANVSAGGGVTVSGGPGNAGGSTPYLVAFGQGPLAGTDVPLLTSTPGSTALSGGSGTGANAVTVSTFSAGGSPGTGFEICEQALRCQPGAAAVTGGAMSSPKGIAVNQSSGHVYVTDRNNRRVVEFDASGNFVRAWGQDVVATGSPHDLGTASLEVCTAADTCKTGVASGTSGSFTPFNANASAVHGSLAVAPVGAPNAGNVVVADPGTNRVQEFTPTGGFVRAFGWDVASAGPGNTGTGFEVCSLSAGDTCKAGVGGTGLGQFGGNGGALVTKVAEDTTGAIYAVSWDVNSQKALRRVQKFSPTSGGTGLEPSVFAPDLTARTSASTLSYSGPTAVAVDPSNDDVYVVQATNIALRNFESYIQRRILRLDSDGNLLDSYLADAEFGSLNDFAVRAGGGSLYFSSSTYRPGLEADVGVPRIYALEDFAPPVIDIGEATDVEGDEATLHATIKPGATPLDTSYRFEYSVNGQDWFPAPPTDFVLGNGSGGSLDPASCPVGNPEVCEVSQEISGLRSNTRYYVRVVATTEYGEPTVVEGDPFISDTFAPIAETGDARWSSPAPTNPSLLLTGKVTASNARTTYQFQYVPQASYEASGFAGAAVAPRLPNPPAEAGHGSIALEVKQSVSGLDPSQPYRYRLVATNSAGTVVGAERVVAAPLPSDRYVEWVSRGDSQSIGIDQFKGITPDGGRAFFSAEAMGNPPSLPALFGGSIGIRGGSGWSARGQGPDPQYSEGFILGGEAPSADLTKMLWDKASPEDHPRRFRNFTIARTDGVPDPAPLHVETLDTVPAAGGATHFLFGASADASVGVFEKPSPGKGLPSPRLFADEPPGAEALPAAVGLGSGSPRLEMVNRDSAGEPIGGTCASWLGGGSRPGEPGTQTLTHAISDDGSVVYFNSNLGAPVSSGPCPENSFPRRVFKRVDFQTTVEVSRSQCDRVAAPGPPVVPACGETSTGLIVPNGADSFQGASADGSVVFISSGRQLTSSDTDNTADLYQYDASPPAGQPQLVQVTAGESVPGDHPIIGSGGKFVSILDSADDGSRIYFIASGRLTPEAKAEGRNVFVFQRDDAHPSGRISYVTELGGTDGKTENFRALPTVSGDGETGDGRFLLFNASRAILPAVDGDSVIDIYRYDDEASGSGLVCITCAGDTSTPTTLNIRGGGGNALRTLGSWRQSEDGSIVVFSTAESLLPADKNTGSPTSPCVAFSEAGCDVYAWRDGQLEFLSGLTANFGAVSPFVSADGRAVFFTTEAQLAYEDNNNAKDVYSLRVGGGTPDAPEPEVTCQESEECHHSTAAPASPASPGSGSYTGPGNPSAGPPRCPKGRVRVKGKCKKKPVKHGKKAHRKNRNRGGRK